MTSLRSLTLAGLFLVWLTALPLLAAGQDDVRKFLKVTGFDVSLESLKFSAASAPSMLGMPAELFGSEWERLVEEVFEVETLHDLAVDILDETMPANQMEHASAFYASSLGQRLVNAENTSHMADDDGLKTESGEAIIDGLRRLSSPRLDYFERMNAATDSAGITARAIVEVQVRFLMAASGAGVIDMPMDEADLRSVLGNNLEEMKSDLEQGALEGAAYTYQAFSDAEVLEYTEALEHADMRAVYDLMNAVQWEILANRFEVLAGKMTRLRPSQEL